MNPDTLVAISCYAGDAPQVVGNIEAYAHHKTHVVILSPHDAPVNFPGWDCKHAGVRAYIGQESLDRQREYLKILLTYPQKFFLFNDSDSMCLSAKIPDFVYAEPDVLWSNEVTEPRPHESPYPKIALQPPYFFSRKVIEKLLSVNASAHPITPYIDWYMLALACESGVPHKAFSIGEVGSPAIHGDTMGIPWGEPWAALANRVRIHGRVFVHPVKSKDHLDRLLEHHRIFKEAHP